MHYLKCSILLGSFYATARAALRRIVAPLIAAAVHLASGMSPALAQALPDPFSNPLGRAKAEAEMLTVLSMDFVQRQNQSMLRSMYFEAIYADEVAAQLSAVAISTALLEQFSRHADTGATRPVNQLEALRNIGPALRVANAGLHMVYAVRSLPDVAGKPARSKRAAELLEMFSELVATTPAALDTPDMALRRQFVLARIAIERARRAPDDTLPERLMQLLPAAQQAGGIASFLTLTALGAAYADASIAAGQQGSLEAVALLQDKAHAAFEGAETHYAAVGPATPELVQFYRVRGYILRARGTPSLVAEKHFQVALAWHGQLFGEASPAKMLNALNYCNLPPEPNNASFAERTFSACETAEKALAHVDLRAYRAENLPTVLLGKGMARVGQKRYADAVAFYRAAVALVGRDQTGTLIHLSSNMGWAQFLAGDTAGALKTLERAVTIITAPATPANQRSAAPYLSLGDIACSQGDIRAAEQYFDQAGAIARERFGPQDWALSRKADLKKNPPVCNRG